MKAVAVQEIDSTARKALLRDQAYSELKSRILGGQFEQGFLSTRSLASELGMSLSPVRSAVERLEHEGLLRIGPQRGILVNDLTIREMTDHFEIREALESLVVSKLAAGIPAEQIGVLRENVLEYERLRERGQIAAFVACDSEFHLLLAGFAGNAEIERVLGQLRDRIVRTATRVIRYVPERMQASIEEHHQIIDLIEQRDGAGAAKIMMEHLRRGSGTLVPRIAANESL